MSRGYGGSSGQLAFAEPAEPSPLVRRALRAGPRLRRIGSVPARKPDETAPAARALTEWHQMSPGERLTAWAGLRAWVTWLNDRYELGTEERLPRCWALHPGLIEELYALRAWREEIYQAPQPSGQAARYWHAELRQVIHAAATIYAAGCRTGHRSSQAPAAADRMLQRRWAEANPVTGVPGAELSAGHQSRYAGEGWLTHAAMAAALDSSQARQPGPGMRDVVLCAGTWWAAVSAGWIQVSDPGQQARMNNSSLTPADDKARRGAD